MKINSYAQNNFSEENYPSKQASASDHIPQGTRYDYGADSNDQAKLQSEISSLATGLHHIIKKRKLDSPEDFVPDTTTEHYIPPHGGNELDPDNAHSTPSIEGNDLAAGNVHHITPTGDASPTADFARQFRSQFSDLQYSKPIKSESPKPTNWTAQKLVAQDRELRDNRYDFVGYMGAGTDDALSRVRDGLPAGPPNNSDALGESWSGRYMSSDPNVAAGYALNNNGTTGAILRAYAPHDLVHDRFFQASEPLDRGNPSYYFGDGRGLAGRSLTGRQAEGMSAPETVMDHSITGDLIMIPSLYQTSDASLNISNPAAEQSIVGLNSAPPEYQDARTASAHRANETLNDPSKTKPGTPTLGYRDPSEP